MCGLLLHPPRREAAVLARLIEEDDVAVGIAQPRFAPHPRLITWAVLEGEAVPRKLLHARVEVIAFEIDGGGCEDLFVGVDLHRQGDAPSGLEARVAGLGAVDDLHEADTAIEIDGSLIIGAG